MSEATKGRRTNSKTAGGSAPKPKRSRPEIIPSTLRDALEPNLVRYVLGKRSVQISVRDKQAVQLDNGRYTEVEVPGFRLERANAITPFSPVFDLEDPRDASIVEMIDRWIEDNPARAQRNGVVKDAGKRRSAPFPTWDDEDTTPAKCVQWVKDGLDAAGCIAYEMQKPEGERRIAVVEAIELFHAEREAAAEAAAAEAREGERFEAERAVGAVAL